MPTTPTLIEAGLGEPVFESQAIFRSALAAMAEPGSIHVPVSSIVDVPLGLHPATAALLLALVDFETPIYIPEWLRSSAVQRYLSFHTGASFVDNPERAAFAVIDCDTEEVSLSAFNQGTDQYPDRSTTILIQTPLLTGGQLVKIAGPGLKEPKQIAPSGLREGFWQEVANNHALYPCGVDLFFCSGDQFFALPRSSRIMLENL